MSISATVLASSSTLPVKHEKVLPQGERAEPGRVTRSWQRVEGRTGVDELADGLSEGVDLLLDLSNLRAETPQRTRFSQTFGREANQG